MEMHIHTFGQIGQDLEENVVHVAADLEEHVASLQSGECLQRHILNRLHFQFESFPHLAFVETSCFIRKQCLICNIRRERTGVIWSRGKHIQITLTWPNCCSKVHKR